MTHAEFVAAYRAGELSVQVDPKAAAQLVTRQMMLPIFLLPVLGIGVALALTGYLVIGVVAFVAALAFRYAVRRSSSGYVLTRSLQDAVFFEYVTAAGILTTEAA
jgi:hypothetical protein